MRSPSGAGNMVGVIALALVLVGLIVFGITEKVTHKDKAATTTTLDRARTATTDTTTTSTVPRAKGVLGQLEGDLPEGIPPRMTTTSSEGATWDPISTITQGTAGASKLDLPCVTVNPPPANAATATWQLHKKGSKADLGDAKVTLIQFVSPVGASLWMAEHSGSTFMKCQLAQSRAHLLTGGMHGSQTSDSNAAVTGVDGGLAVHYSAAAVVGGKTCQYYADDFWTAAGRQGVQATFSTCGQPFNPQLMQGIIDAVVSVAKNLK